MITVKHLSHQVRLVEESLSILKDISLQIENGQSVAITGASGSGKTSLLGFLAGLDVPSEGDIFIDHHCITSMNEDQRAVLRGQMIGFVFQSFHLLDDLTALENVALPLQLKGDKHSFDKAREYLQQVGLERRINHYSNTLSGGEKQRVAIARAFAHQPRYLLADEPTGNLDNKTGQQIIDLLFRLNTLENTTLVLVTHDKHLAGLCQREFILQQGQLHER